MSLVPKRVATLLTARSEHAAWKRFVRPTVDVEEGWVPLPWRIAEGFDDPAVEGVTSPLIAQPLWPRQGDCGLPLAVEIGQLLLARAIGVTQEHFWRCHGIRGREGEQGTVLGVRHPRHLTRASDDALGDSATGSPHAVDGHVSLILDGKGNPGAVCRP